jgi:hypothetical protein
MYNKYLLAWESGRGQKERVEGEEYDWKYSMNILYEQNNEAC